MSTLEATMVSRMQRKAIIAREVGETQEDTAERFGVGRSAISMRISRARARGAEIPGLRRAIRPKQMPDGFYRGEM